MLAQQEKSGYFARDLMALCKLLAVNWVDNSERCKQLCRARCVLLNYTAFTNLICIKE